jgi:hypothetical protein
VLFELKMYADEWPEVVNLVQSVLNNSLSTRLNKTTPMQVFTGHAETAPIALILKDVIDILCRDNKAECLYALFNTCGDPTTSQSQPYLLCSASRTNLVLLVMSTITVVG